MHKGLAAGITTPSVDAHAARTIAATLAIQ